MSIEVRSIRKRFGTFQALKGVSLTVPEGELVALLGPSGSGKTTLLRIIAGLELPDPPGSVLIHGEDVTFRPPGRRRVGFVFQHYALFRHMTVFENVAFGLRVRPRATRPSEAKIRERVMELLRLVQLEGYEQRRPAELSGGQRQRVALARALAIDPQVLLLDEPFGALDAKVRQRLRRWLRRLHDEIHVTGLFVTHDQEEALEVADRIVLMNEGRVEQVGTPDQVYHHPANMFVMDFLGQVNLFRGRVEAGRLMVGPWPLAPQPADLNGHRKARLFVRPHEVEVRRQANGSPGLPARVVRIHSAGPQVRLDLALETGDLLRAELPHEAFHQAALGLGDPVSVTFRNLRVFAEP
ncbi:MULTISPECIES: sulfate/molybdate ABC transporter ATP-binding protein [Limnochorda]|mgnify:CR=1 FL=1|uniref:sulfate/molybdate ABC transporter ATP-binding protein n=1 Tax=Limnochorda TaxID=1676651 RepID=UPI0017EE5702|nr:sulfate ABC transporter ATP-binding protein [Bacillota bacterium]MBO2520088.1 sulfate ABC transporter ATP-binding protein [Bacillota bacterium]NMA71588.1 sulfate ABC transporter ATP-binding protein [Bacillota bacterium]